MAVHERVAVLLKDKALRRRALGTPRAALLVAQTIDRGQRRDTLNAVVRGNDDYSLRTYLREVLGDLSQLPAKMRMELSKRGIDMHSEMGFTKFHAHSGGGWQGERRDYVDEITNAVIREATAFAFRDLNRRYRRRTRADKANLARAMAAMKKWADNRDCSSPPASFMSIARRYYPGFLSWLDQDFWGAYHTNISPEKPLKATTEGKVLPKKVFLGQLGRCGEDSYIRAPTVLTNELHGMRGGPAESTFGPIIRGGLEAAGPGGDHIWQWWESLIPREKRLVRNRLAIGKDQPVTGDVLMGNLAAVWGAATPIDAELWYDSDIIHQVDVMSTPFLWAFPWKTPRGQVGWILLYPDYDAQISNKAREGGLYRVAAAK
jgi:hypothetical protein